ncbi:DUF4185 domain-containing protein [Pedobacter metabolipauper]|uniref:Uncharacterized protein DUF4185 n=1 Tax=Pedobacter metabolipauper TaxID=425513 RepID=A0A4R6SZW7_9SPHI|nr:DUF4185 domain-containing protein [Pedobacter metabolipauper]TDQ10312.1 uncharacterized protein DUF4185 [Pedobacter metabolipauper]
MNKTGIFLVLLLSFMRTELIAQDLEHIKFTAEKATEWNQLFTRDSGWYGGDGIYSIPLNGKEHAATTNGKTLFIFSDSMIGRLKNGARVKIQDGSKMIHNATALLTGITPDSSKLTFHWNTSAAGNAETVFIPKTPMTGPRDYYWLGDGFVNPEKNHAIYLFGYRIKQISDGTFGFSEIGNTLIKIEAKETPPYKNYKQFDTPFYISKESTKNIENVKAGVQVESGETGSFGAGIYVNTIQSGAAKPDGFIYVYGVKGNAKKLLAARVRPKDFEDYTKWNFWNGTQWQADMKQSAAITDQVSNELSVTALPDGRYALIFQQGGIGSHVGMRLGKTPYGPFGPIIKIWDCTPDLIQKTYFAYNAKAHPSLSPKGELLISYNINSFDFLKDLSNDPQLYRPRFIRIKFEEAIKQ